MFNRQRLNELDDTARLLTTQADLYRGILQAEVASLQRTWGWLGALGGALRSPSPLLMAGAVAVGVLAMRNWRGVLRWLPTLLTGWRLARTFLAPPNGR